MSYDDAFQKMYIDKTLNEFKKLSDSDEFFNKLNLFMKETKDLPVDENGSPISPVKNKEDKFKRSWSMETN